jgi:MerR family mercuric resistance operon transcriptional regulator
VNAPAARARTISLAAAEAGVHVETIRYYERLGLIPQPPRGRSYRHYPDATVRALRFIRQAREFGFTLKEIELLLALERRDAGCADMCGQVELKVAELDRKIAALSALRDELSRLLKQSPRRGRHTECKVYECLSGGASC